MNTILLVAIIAVSFMILYFVVNFHSSDSLLNAFLQFVGIGFVFIMIIILSKAVLDDQNYCSLVTDNATVTGSTTHYDYTYFCYTNPNNTSVTFYTTIMWLIRIIVGFAVAYAVYVLGKLMLSRLPLLRGKT